MKHFIRSSAVLFFLHSSAIHAFVPSNSNVRGLHGVSETSTSSAFKHAQSIVPRISVEQRAVSLPSIPISLPTINLGIDNAKLTQFFLETLITNGVPAVFWIVVIAFAAKSIKSAKEAGMSGPNGGLFGKTALTELYDDLYGSANGQKPMLPFGKPQKTLPKNLGIPENEFLKIVKLNDKYQSFDFTLTSATQSKAKAAAKYRSQAFDSALKKSFDSSIAELNMAQKSDLLTEEKAFLIEGSKILNSINQLQLQLTEKIIAEEMKAMDVDIGEIDAYGKEGKSVVDATIVDEKKDGSADKKKDVKTDNKSINKLMKEIEKKNTELLRLEMEFIRAVIEIMGADRANAIRAALLGNIAGGAAGVAGGLLKSLQDRPLSAVLATIGYSDEEKSSKNLFVTEFNGDVSASQVENLREEVTAIIRAAKPGDEALLKLTTGGGTVTGYGLAAAQLKRFKANGIKLTICVEQVAASGGYMMTCIADKVIASPFAVLGSIGVISDLPNVYERLKKEGIEFQTITAGKYKRTLTPTKKVTEEDIEKSKEDLEQVLKLFKAFVAENRPSLDIDNVATGETWFGNDALDKGLCDELRTVDDVLCNYVDDGYDVYKVTYDPFASESSLGGLLPVGAEKSSKNDGIVKSATRWLVKNIGSAVKEELASEFQSTSSSSNVKERYQMRDPDAADRIKLEL